MNKLCCFPSETPELTLNVKCVSTCCAKNVKTKDNLDCNREIELNDEDKIKVNDEKDKVFCCCFKRKTSVRQK